VLGDLLNPEEPVPPVDLEQIPIGRSRASAFARQPPGIAPWGEGADLGCATQIWHAGTVRRPRVESAWCACSILARPIAWSGRRSSGVCACGSCRRLRATQGSPPWAIRLRTSLIVLACHLRHLGLERGRWERGLRCRSRWSSCGCRDCGC